ncbi:MAG: hypothetical protein ACRDRV_05250 [Pseudonocardiaceae bacterium]
MSQRDVVQRWLSLSHQVLVEEVHQLVRSHDDRAHRCWNVVREHPVLAARVRGILSALERQSADYRDAAMWRVWITQARNALTSPRPPSSHSRPPVPEPGTADEVVIEQPRVSSSTPAPPARMIFREPGQ